MLKYFIDSRIIGVRSIAYEFEKLNLKVFNK